MCGADITISAKEILDRSRARSAHGPDHSGWERTMVIRLFCENESRRMKVASMSRMRGGSATDEGCAPRVRRMKQCHRQSRHS